MSRPQVIALLEAVKDAPDDPTPRLVLADWLEEHGDDADRARARLLRGPWKPPSAVQIGPDDPDADMTYETTGLESQWLASLAERGLKASLAGPFVELHLSGEQLHELPGSGLPGTEDWAWVWGVEVSTPAVSHGSREVPLGSDPVVAAALAPLLGRLNKLVIRNRREEANLNDLRPSQQALIHSALDREMDECLKKSPDEVRLTDLAIVRCRAEELMHFISRASGFIDGRFDNPIDGHLTSLSVYGCESVKMGLIPLLSPCSRLTALDLGSGCNTSSFRLKQFVDAPGLARLRRLSFAHPRLIGDCDPPRHGDIGYEVPYLAASPHSARLTALDLRGQRIRESGLLALLESPHLTGLKRLLVSDFPDFPDSPHHHPFRLGAALDTARALGFELRDLGTEGTYAHERRRHLELRRP
jgi:uncharacterized protein (TIGR02996 family)